MPEDTPFVTNSALQPGNVREFLITTPNDSLDVTGALSQFSFYESVFSNTVTATAILVDTGFQGGDNGKGRRKSDGIRNYLSLVGGERVDFTVSDNNMVNTNKESTIKLTMYINRIRDLSTNALKDVFAIDLVSREFINNEKVRVTERYDGPISESALKIMKLLTKGSPTEADLQGVETVDQLQITSEKFPEGRIPVPEIQKTEGNYNFIGNSKKPLYVLSWLASKSVSQNKDDKTGFFFYQSRDRFHFISIDSLVRGDRALRASSSETNLKLKQGRKVKSFVYNSTGKINEEKFDQNILSYNVKKTVDAQKDLSLGSYGSRTLFFDFLSMNYRVDNFDIVEAYAGNNQSGIPISPQGRGVLRVPRKEIREGQSRLLNQVLDVGTLPSGVNTDSQLAEFKKNIEEESTAIPNIIAESIARYNVLFSVETNVIIPGDFDIIPGDIVNCTFRPLNPTGGEDKDLDISGEYMVASVCHRISPTETLSSLDLVREYLNPRSVRTQESNQ